jgi:hypothetical protein
MTFATIPCAIAIAAGGRCESGRAADTEPTPPGEAIERGRQSTRLKREGKKRAAWQCELSVQRECGVSYTDWQRSAAWASKIAVYQHQG